MQPLALHEFYQGLNARFDVLNGMELVGDHGDVAGEYSALRESVAVMDLSFRSRICLTGSDRVRFLHGQVTNDVKRLRAGDGCYAALVTAKGRMQSDLNIHSLQDELLLDFEPGLTAAVSERLEKYLVSDDVQVIDVAPHYGLLTVQGPKAEFVVSLLALFPELPAKRFQSLKIADATLGDIYLISQPRLSSPLPAKQEEGTEKSSILRGFDLFVPTPALGAVADKLIAAAKSVGGRACGWQALEMTRIEAGIPRFGADMDESNIPLECGIEERAVSYSKGCYIGQEVINRIHSIGHVNRELRGLRLADNLKALPVKGDKLFHSGKEVGYITSAVTSPALNASVALGYVRREVNQPGTMLELPAPNGASAVEVVALPF